MEFSAPGHPESPERISKSIPLLQKYHDVLWPEPATENELLKAHSREHLQRIKNLEFWEPDCPPYPKIYEYASLAAGAAILASRIQGFSLMRPPGHHASRDRIAGFCYVNNIAVAVKNSGKRTLIIDIDGHHGDGTQAIFLGDPQIIFLSLHSSPNYPGTGLRSERNCHNIPLPHYCGDQIYLEALDRALAEINLMGIEQIALSAGFDTFQTDPLASLGLTSSCYQNIGSRIAELKLPRFAVLEGGYDVKHLAMNIHRFLQGLFGHAGKEL
ncbi:histone deacetylase family protein [Candidatus Acetothermia bacterium]|nr:histone deacetylase family protein [Candidatus Acetothermia bacterium]